jgi:ribosomal protein S18 acetylase RimI-like enzyme
MARIRKATVADVPALAVLNAYVQNLHVAAEPEIYRATAPRELEQRLRETLEWQGTHVLLAEVDDEPAGSVVMREVVSEGHTYIHPARQMMVDQLVVAPEFRRRGVGRALMTAVDRHAKEAGLTGIVLDVRAHNEDAIAFYQQLGYAPAQWRMWRRLT